MARGTTTSTADSFKRKSHGVSRSTKNAKPAGRVFGTSSQFRGVGNGVQGDPRK